MPTGGDRSHTTGSSVVVKPTTRATRYEAYLQRLEDEICAFMDEAEAKQGQARDSRRLSEDVS